MNVHGIVMLSLPLTTKDRTTWQQEVRNKWKGQQDEKKEQMKRGSLRNCHPHSEKQRKQQNHSYLLLACSWLICLFGSLLIHIYPLPSVSDSSCGWPKWHDNKCLFNVPTLPPIDTHQEEPLQTDLNGRETDTHSLTSTFWRTRGRVLTESHVFRGVFVGGTHTGTVSEKKEFLLSIVMIMNKFPVKELATSWTVK